MSGFHLGNPSVSTLASFQFREPVWLPFREQIIWTFWAAVFGIMSLDVIVRQANDGS